MSTVLVPGKTNEVKNVSLLEAFGAIPATKAQDLPKLDEDGNVLVFVKYKNRKIYNKNKGHYVNASYLIDVIQKGFTVNVICAVSGEDLTAEVLLSCMVKIKNANVDALHELIKASI